MPLLFYNISGLKKIRRFTPMIAFPPLNAAGPLREKKLAR